MKRLIFKFHCLVWYFGRADFYRDLADALDLNVGLLEFLSTQAKNSRMVKDQSSERVYQAMAQRVARGGGAQTPISNMVRGIAPAADQLLLKAVDDAVASKNEALRLTADAVEFQKRSLLRISAELAMPAIAIPLVGASCFIFARIISGVVASSPSADIWTGFNGFARWLAEFIYAYAAPIVGVSAALVAAVVYALPRWTGAIRIKAEEWPVANLYRDYNAAIVLSSLAMMTRSGKTMREALESLRSASNPWLRWHVTRILRSLEDNPNDYIAAFGRGLMPKTVRARLASLMDSKKSFSESLVLLGTKEITRLEKRVALSAEATGWALMSVLIAIVVVLSIGTMTIASALGNTNDPSARLIQRSQAAQ